ncbi:MAG: acetyl-CoA carboxylase carboxyltransferase subunit beta [Firmicutes bacterium]|nr:acetyl-CoA carboxylase carboxyltransferase subunit beta [Bacillota bacterium]
MLNSLFRGRHKYATLKPRDADAQREVPGGLWTKCDECGQIIYNKELKKNLMVCPRCGYYFRVSAWERISQLIDEGTFQQLEDNVVFQNPLGFPGYEERIERARQDSGIESAVISGMGLLDSHPVVIVCMDFAFIGATMGSMEGEKIALAVEAALESRRPLIVVATSGGARMHEGILALMQMAKTSAALSRFHDEGLLYITVLTSPTYGGVSASFGWLGDIIIAEPKAAIGFAGKRTIEQTGERLPEGFQTAEFMLQHGLIDLIVERKALRQTLSDLLDLHGVERVSASHEVHAGAGADGTGTDVAVLGGSADGQ